MGFCLTVSVLCSDRSVVRCRRCLRPALRIGVQSPQVSLCVRLQADLLFGARSQRLNPNYAKLCFVLPILNDDHTSHRQLAPNSTQSNPSLADIQGVDQF